MDKFMVRGKKGERERIIIIRNGAKTISLCLGDLINNNDRDKIYVFS
jgi:hypothetical protein